MKMRLVLKTNSLMRSRYGVDILCIRCLKWWLFIIPPAQALAEGPANKIAPTKAFNAEALLKTPTTQTVDIKVYTTADFVKQNLTLPHITFTDDLQDADIIWVVQDFNEWDKLKDNQRISQVPNESCLTYKHNLANLLS